jgi:hypothetical protein
MENRWVVLGTCTAGEHGCYMRDQVCRRELLSEKIRVTKAYPGWLEVSQLQVSVFFVPL